jgi:hypothetical protein
VRAPSFFTRVRACVLSCTHITPTPTPRTTHHASNAKGVPPSYFIVAGLVFTPATTPYLKVRERGVG